MMNTGYAESIRHDTSVYCHNIMSVLLVHFENPVLLVLHEVQRESRSYYRLTQNYIFYFLGLGSGLHFPWLVLRVCRRRQSPEQV